MMLNSDYVTYDAAEALYEAGFDLPVDGFLIITDKPWKTMPRPLLQQAEWWLRRKAYVSIRINATPSRKTWFWDMLDLTDGSYDDSAGNYYDEYEEAQNAAIIAACKYIKER